MDRRKFLAASAASAAALIAGRALAANPLPRGRIDTIEPLAAGDPRIRVWCPPDYDTRQSSHRTLYMLDGQYAFAEDSDGTNFAADRRVARLMADGTIAPTVIVALDNLVDDRFLQYMPQTIYDRGPAAMRTVVEQEMARVGGKPLVSAQFLAFVTSRLKPHIDATYRVSPDRSDTAIFGASMAGVMAGALFVEGQDSFGRGGCMSPNWAIYDARMADVPGLPRLWGDYFAQLGAPQGRRLWLDHGTRMMDAGMAAHQIAIAESLDALDWQRGCNLQVRVYEAGHAFAQTATQMDEMLAWLLA